MAAATVRVAQPDEAETISALLRAAFAEFAPRYTPQALARSTPEPGEVRQRFDEGPIWVAVLDGATVGTVSALSRSDGLFVRSMAVVSAARGHGVAKQLLAVVADFAGANRYRRLILTTTPFLSVAIHLYQDAGFRFTGETLDVFGTPLLEMEKALSTAP